MREPALVPNARRIFDLRYSRKGDSGEPTETPAEAIDRVVANVASVNALYAEPGEESGVLDDLPPQVEGYHKGDAAEHFPFRTAHRQYDWLRKQGRLDASLSLSDRLDRGWYEAEEQVEQYREMLTNLDFVPNSPTWTGAGTELGQLAACFVLPVEDDLGRTPDSIYQTLRNAALIQQTGGGNGFDFSRLRPKDALVRTSMGKATGPVGFAKSYDAVFGIIAQGGTRRGANMGILRVDHPDIREFVRAKIVEGEMSNFNISVAITDRFMEAVEKDEDFDLIHEGKVYGSMQAREFYDEIIHNAWIIGDPGSLFIDRANRDNPLPLRYDLAATNPCGEQWLGPYENCCLGSINLKNFATPEEHVGPDITRRPEFDWERLARVAALATQFLDDVIDANQYVPDVPQLEESAQGARRIGLGGMGLADAMTILGIPYGSEQGQAFAAQVTEWIRYHSMLASIERAKERGPFEWIGDSIYNPILLDQYGPGAEIEDDVDDGEGGWETVEYRLWSPPETIMDLLGEFGRPEVHWDRVVEGITEHGIRNACQLTYAPTGTISNVAGLQGSGCEPFFALVYQRNVMQEGENITLDYLNPIFEDALIREGLTEAEREVVMEHVKDNGGSCQGLDILPERIQNAFHVAADVTPEGHVRMQAAIQQFVDNSISKTINLPFEATEEDVSDVYRLAYDLGCKGITIYRQGSRELEVLSTGTKKEVEAEPSPLDLWPVVDPMKMPPEAEEYGLPARTIKVLTPHGAMWATVTEHPDYTGRPFDVRLTVGKAGNDKMADIEAIGRACSLALRSGVSVGHLVEQLEGIGGQSVIGFGPNRVKSAADGLAQALRRTYLEDQGTVEIRPSEGGVVDPTRVCPECHNASMVMEQGCFHCEPRLGGCGGYTGCD